MTIKKKQLFFEKKWFIDYIIPTITSLIAGIVLYSWNWNGYDLLTINDIAKVTIQTQTFGMILITWSPFAGVIGKFIKWYVDGDWLRTPRK
jgi:hypothetical protein